MTQASDTRHEIKTLLRLIAPETVDVELVPLASVEKAEFLFFWATIFLTAWGTVFGTWLSLVVVDFPNKPVANLLLAVLAFLTLLVIAFSRAGFQARSTARKRVSSASSAAKPSFSERMDRTIKKLLTLLPAEFTEAQFLELVNKFDDEPRDGSLGTTLFERMQVTRVIVKVEGSNDPIKYKAATERPQG
jgi:hypothetical protein